MKKILSLAFTLGLSFHLLFAQSNPVYKINYKFLIDQSILEINPDTETDEAKKVLASTAAMMLLFQDENLPVAEIWLNNEYVRSATTMLGENYEIINKITLSSTEVYPYEKKYIFKEDGADEKTIYLGDKNILSSALEIDFSDKSRKEIAGYNCKLAKIHFAVDQQTNTDLIIWYTEDLPNLYWGEYAYLKNIPGAALEISTSGLGIIASEVEKSSDPDDDILFMIPEDYEQVESLAEVDSAYEEIENVDNNEVPEDIYMAEDRIAYYDEQTQLFGIKDQNDNIIVEPMFNIVNPYINNIAIVTNDDYKTGAIDLDGNIVFPFQYDMLHYNDQDDTYVFAINAKYGLYDGKGNVVIPNEYDYLTTFEDGLSIFSLNEKYGLLDMNNNIIVPAEYEFISDYTDKNFIIYDVQSERYSLVDIKSKKTITTYDYLYRSYYKDVFIVMKDNAYGYINSDGKVIIPIKYSYAGSFVDGKAEVMLPDREESFFINIKGEEVK